MTEPHTGLVVQPYRTDRGENAWVFRCWGTDTCDGWLSLDHSSQQSAERARDRHVAEEHTASATVTDPDYLRQQYAAAIWERQNPGRRWADCEYRWRADAEDAADAVLQVRDRHLDQLRQRLRLAAEAHRDAEGRLQHLQASSEAAGRLLTRTTDERDQLRDAVDRVRQLHQPVGVVAAAEAGVEPDCAVCGPNRWPCPTYQAVADLKHD
jgi:hypothetical protein